MRTSLFLLLTLLIHFCAFGQESAMPRAQPSPALGSAGSNIPPYIARFGRTKPIIAVVGENTFTELTDYVIPYGVLSEAGIAQVFALATQAGPIQMFPALRIQPQATTAEFDTRFPDGADYVIVPAVHKIRDPALIQWVSSQARKGATIVGVCDGVWVLANAGLLDGKNAVGHWYSFDDLIKKFPKANFVKNRRYLADGAIITTTGVTASMPVSIALVEAIAGHTRATLLAQSLGIQRWGPSHRSEDFHLSARHAFTAAKNWLSFWSHESIGIPIADGVDEISLALAADAISRTYRSDAYAMGMSVEPVKSKRGLVIYPDNSTQLTKRSDRVLEITAHGMRSADALDWALRYITEHYGNDTAKFVALQIEYPQ